MARINLLPWRDWERQRRKREFLVNMGATLGVGALLVLLGGWFLDGRIDNQKSRNDFLRSEIRQLDRQIAEIADLRQKREELLARIRVILELQTNRPIIVKVFDELVRTLAPGVHFISLRAQGTIFTLDAQAESNNRISALMRNLERSDLFASPNLKSIKEDPENPHYGAQASAFNLTFERAVPEAEADAARTTAATPGKPGSRPAASDRARSGGQ